MPFIHKWWRQLGLAYSSIHRQKDSSNFSSSFKVSKHKMLELLCIIMTARMLVSNTTVYFLFGYAQHLDQTRLWCWAVIILASRHSHSHGHGKGASNHESHMPFHSQTAKMVGVGLLVNSSTRRFIQISISWLNLKTPRFLNFHYILRLLTSWNPTLFFFLFFFYFFLFFLLFWYITPCPNKALVMGLPSSS